MFNQFKCVVLRAALKIAFFWISPLCAVGISYLRISPNHQLLKMHRDMFVCKSSGAVCSHAGISGFQDKTMGDKPRLLFSISFELNIFIYISF